MFKDKRCLVTGGTGLVGRELVQQLLNAGAHVRSVSLDDNNFDSIAGYFEDYKYGSLEHIKSDLRFYNNAEKAVEDMDYVFHIAGVKGSPVMSKSMPYTFFTNFIQLNTSVIAAMYESFRRGKMKWGVYTSTVGTYGPAEVFKEDELWDQNPSPHDWYAGWAKRMGEVQIEGFEKQYGKQCISIGKPVNIYGAWDNFNLVTSTMVPSLVKKAVDSEGDLVVWGDGTAERDIMHARDVARALKLLVEKKVVGAVNIGRGKGHSIKDIATEILKNVDSNKKIVYDASKPTGDAMRVADISKLESLGFVPGVRLQAGIKETVDWYKANRRPERYEPFFTPDHVNLWI